MTTIEQQLRGIIGTLAKKPLSNPMILALEVLDSCPGHKCNKFQVGHPSTIKALELRGLISRKTYEIQATETGLLVLECMRI